MGRFGRFTGKVFYARVGLDPACESARAGTSVPLAGCTQFTRVGNRTCPPSEQVYSTGVEDGRGLSHIKRGTVYIRSCAPLQAGLRSRPTLASHSVIDPPGGESDVAHAADSYTDCQNQTLLTPGGQKPRTGPDLLSEWDA